MDAARASVHAVVLLPLFFHLLGCKWYSHVPPSLKAARPGCRRHACAGPTSLCRWGRLHARQHVALCEVRGAPLNFSPIWHQLAKADRGVPPCSCCVTVPAMVVTEESDHERVQPRRKKQIDAVSQEDRATRQPSSFSGVHHHCTSERAYY